MPTGSRDIACIWTNRMKLTVAINTTPRKAPIPIVKDARWAPGPFWMSMEKIIS